MAIPTIAQPHFKAGNIPDLICELVLLPGKLVAAPFHDRGAASPEFLLRARLATVAIFGSVSFCLPRLNNSKHS